MNIGDRTTYYHPLLDLTFKVEVIKITKRGVVIRILDPLPSMTPIRAFTHRQAETLGS